MMRHALWFPLFEELADPRTVARLAADAEEAGEASGEDAQSDAE